MTEPARLDGESPPRTHKRAKQRGLRKTVKVVAEALLIALVVRTFLFEPFDIPSGSLIPTLLVGDYIFVAKYSYGYSKFSFPLASDLVHGRVLGSLPKRGDVAVFTLPRDGNTDYIKRIIGLPGDTIQLVHSRLIINGQLVPRKPTAEIVTEDAVGRKVPVPTYIETLPGGTSHLIIQRDGDSGFLSNTGVYKVPPGEYFVMGDNRDNSTDSRLPADHGGIGYVPLQDFIGKAEVVFFSVKRGEPAWKFWQWPWTVRWHRIFQPIH